VTPAPSITTGTRTTVVERTPVVAFGPGAPAWHDLSDPVMGGRSHGEMLIADGVGVFTGVVSLEHGGGFASVRSREGRHDLAAFDGLVVRVRSDGQRYGLRLRTTTSRHGVNYQADLHPAAGAWQEVWLPFASFRPVFRGRPVPDHPPLDPAGITTFGLIIGGRQEGPFRLEVASIRPYSGLPPGSSP
jgi:monofunctional biosynthetic peptidoglycan transglycosylase